MYVICKKMHLNVSTPSSSSSVHNAEGRWGTTADFATRFLLFSLVHDLSLNGEGRWGTTDDLATWFLHFSCSVWFFGPVHSLMLSFHFFLCLPCLLHPFTVPCHMERPDQINGRRGLARPSPDLFNGRRDDTTAVCVSLRWSRRSTCGPITCWILAGTSSLVTWSCWGWSFCSCDTAAVGKCDDLTVELL